MFGKRKKKLLIFFLSAIIIAILFFLGEVDLRKKNKPEQLTMKATVVEHVHKETKEKDITQAPVVEEQIEENDEAEQKTYTNIDTSNDYVNFEKLIMQISEYTTPDEINETGDQQ